MEILLFIILAFLVCVAYLLGGKDLISPWFLLCLACFVSYFIVLVNYKNWEIEINATFAIYLIAALLAVGVGTKTVDLITKPRASVIGIDKKRYIAVKYPTFLMASIAVFTCSVYMVKLVLDSYDGATSLSVIMRNIYNNIVDNHYSPGFLFNQMREIGGAIAYVSMFRLILRIYSKDDKVSIIGLLIPILFFVVLSIVSSDRNIFLRFAIFSLCIWVIVYRGRKRKNGKKFSNLEIVLKAIIILTIVFVLFYLFGKVKLYTSDLNRMLGIYGGSGLYNFNLWVQDFNGDLTYGKTTFTTLLSTLETVFSPFGVDFNLTNVDVEFITYTSSNGYVYSSNIYSALLGYVTDFGFLGVIIFPFLFGMFHQWLFNCARKGSGFFVLAFCLLIYSVIYFPIDEQLFGRLHLGFIYEIGWLAIIYYAIFGHRRVKRLNLRKEGGYFAKNN